MEIPLFVLVLQIGFNAALNNRGYSSNSIIPSPRFVNSGQTRRFPEPYNYMALSSRGIPESDEQIDSEYSNSLEDYSYRSVRPLQSRSNHERNEYSSYNNTRPGNDISLEAAPVRRINSDNYADILQQSSYLTRRTDPYFNRPNLSNRPLNLIPSHNHQYYRKTNDDLSLEVSSHESSNSEDASRLGEEATYLRSLLSLIEQPSNRRGQNRKYYRQENSLSSDMSPIDKLNPTEEALNSLHNSFNKRRNNNPDAYADTILLVNDDDQPSETPKSVSPQPSISYSTLYNRRYDNQLNPNEDFYSYLSPFHGPNLYQRRQKLANDSPLTRKFNRKSNNNAGTESSLNDDLFTNSDNAGKLTVLRLASLEELNHSNNRKSNHRNFLRLSLSPDNKLTLDEGVASDLSEILSETLDELNLTPVNLRRTDGASNKYSRRENNRNSADEDNINNMFLLRLGNSYNPNTASPLRSNNKPVNRNSYTNLRVHGNHTRENLKKLPPAKPTEPPAPVKPIEPSPSKDENKTGLNFKKLFDEHANHTLVDNESKRNHLFNNEGNENQNNKSRNDNTSLDTMPAFKKEGNTSSNIAVLPTINQDNLNNETTLLRSSDKMLPKNTTVTLHLEFPWNDQMSPDGDKIKSQLRSDDKKDDTKDGTLNLEFPWNNALSSDSDKRQLRTNERTNKSKDTTDALDLEFPWNDAMSPGADKGKTQLRSDEKKDETTDTTKNLQLQFPWNGALSSNSDKSKSQLRSDEKNKQNKDATDNLNLEFPWNEALSPNSNKDKSQLRTDKTKDTTNDSNNILNLEFPWNEALSPNSNKDKSQLRTDKTKDTTNDSNNTLNLEFPWNDVLSPDADKGKSQLRTDRNMKNTIDKTDYLDLEFPWNDALSPDSHKSITPLRSKDDTKDTTDILNLEFPWNEQLSPAKTKSEGPKPQSLLRIQADNRQEKEPNDDLKLEFPWNDKTSPDKPSIKQTTLRIPDPFFIHPYLRNRNVKKHPNYFRRSYDEFSERLRLRNLKDKTANYLRRQSKRRRNDNLGVSLSRRSSDRRRQRLRSKENIPPLVTTTSRPKYSRSLHRAGRKGDRKTYNDTIIFPNN